MHANVKNVLSANKNCSEHDNLEYALLKKENDRLLELLISQDFVHTAVYSLAEIVDYQNMEKSYLDEYAESAKSKRQLNQQVEGTYCKFKGKSESEGANSDNTSKVIFPGMYKIDLEPFSPKPLRNREAHVDYLKHTQETADTLYAMVEHARELKPLDSDLDSDCKFVTRIQELLVYVSATCLSSIKQSETLIAVTQKNKNKKVRFTEPSSSSRTPKQTDSNKVKETNKLVLPSIGISSSTNARK
nr:hypothetical protein [Tanacetum cinerariifolium]